MDERVWEKTAQFLKELRCEDTGRLSQLQLPEYQKAMKEKFSYQPIYEKTVAEMTNEQRCVIENYVGLTEQCAEEENQQAYLQGIVVYYGKNVPLFRRNGYRKSGAMIP